jgi:hypothetical protein
MRRTSGRAGRAGRTRHGAALEMTCLGSPATLGSVRRTSHNRPGSELLESRRHSCGRCWATVELLLGRLAPIAVWDALDDLRATVADLVWEATTDVGG